MRTSLVLFILILCSAALSRAQIQDSLDLLLTQPQTNTAGTFIVRKQKTYPPKDVRTLSATPDYDGFPFWVYCGHYYNCPSCAGVLDEGGTMRSLYVGYQHVDYSFIEVGYATNQQRRWVPISGFQLEFNLQQDIIGLSTFVEQPLLKINGGEWIAARLNVGAYQQSNQFALTARPELGVSIPYKHLSNFQLRYGRNLPVQPHAIHGVNDPYFSISYRFPFYGQ